MADNTTLNTGSAGDVIATDDISGVKYQRIKLIHGADGVNAGDVSTSNGLPVSLSAETTKVIGTVNVGSDPDTTTTGTISATDAVVGAPAGTGALLSGTSTANSYVSLLCPGGDTAWNLQVTGTFGSGTVYFEVSLDSTNGVDGNWIAVNGRQTGVINTVLSNGTTVAGVFRGNTSGTKYFRARIVGATTPSVAVVIRLSVGTGAIFQNASTPAGTNNIGTIGIAPQTTGGLTTYHLVSAATTNATNIKASAGQVFGWYIYNSNAAARKVVFHNTAGTPTAGASVFFAIMIPATSGANVFSETGIAFSTGIAITTVTDLTDAGTTAVALNDLIINIFYK